MTAQNVWVDQNEVVAGLDKKLANFADVAAERVAEVDAARAAVAAVQEMGRKLAELRAGPTPDPATAPEAPLAEAAAEPAAESAVPPMAKAPPEAVPAADGATVGAGGA